MRQRLLIFFLLCFVIPIAAQNETPTVGVISNTDAVSDAYVLFSPTPLNIAYLIDNQGYVLHQWQSDLPMQSIYLLENGDLLASLIQGDNDFPGGGTGQVVRLDWDSNIVWLYEFSQADAQIHHDIELLPNGNVLMLMWETLTPDEFSDWGFNPALVPDDGSNLYFDRVIEVNPETSEIVWDWRMLDHGIQNYDESLANFGIPAANPHLIDLNYSHRRPRAMDRTHFNGIDYNADLDQILVSAHFQSEIWIIDRATGDLVYRWGNPAVYGRGLDENRMLFNQHNPTWLDNGNILIFNNGGVNVRPFSTVVEITSPLNPDGSYALLEGAAYEPIEPVWVYGTEPPEDFFARNTSGAQRLPNGNTFITDGPNGRLFEIDIEGNILWEYINPIWRNPEEPTITPIFRANRYLPDDPAFEGRDLNPQSALELTYIDGDGTSDE